MTKGISKIIAILKFEKKLIEKKIYKKQKNNKTNNIIKQNKYESKSLIKIY